MLAWLARRHNRLQTPAPGSGGGRPPGLAIKQRRAGEAGEAG
jgi:hypothetical protein